MIAAVVDVLDAGQKVLLDRIDLAWVEGRAMVASTMTSVALLIAGLAFLLVGWCALNAVGVLLLSNTFLLPQAIALVAAVNIVAGAAALMLARRQTKSIVETAGPEAGHEARPAQGGMSHDPGLRRADRSAAGVARS
ncbi:MAG: hypothetical protein AB1689_02320 [Thermodesulfobacteriota bacterium]